MASLKDVARIAQVSMMTVSRVINKSPHVNEKTRERVLKTIKELNYHPNIAARALNKKKSNIIGIVLPGYTSSLSAPYFVQLLYNIESELSYAGYDTLLLTSTLHEIEYEVLFKQKKVDGFIVVAPAMDDQRLNSLADTKIPIVLIHGRNKGQHISFVDIDNQAAVREVVNYIYKNGHRRIGVITGNLNEINALDRLQGYKKGLEENGLEYDAALVFNGNWLPESGYAALKYFHTMSDPPTALFCSNDYMALGAIKYAHDHTIDIPEQISIIGFDNIEIASFISPTITTMEQPFDVIANSAAQMIVQRIENPDQERTNTILSAQLIIRETCQHL